MKRSASSQGLEAVRATHDLQTAAADLLRGLKAYGDARVLESEFALLVEKLSSGQVELKDGQVGGDAAAAPQ